MPEFRSDVTNGYSQPPDYLVDSLPERYVFELYVAGRARSSGRAIHNLRALCERWVPGRYHIDIIDIVDAPDVLRREQIIAAPTLVRRSPLPVRRFIGDVSRTQNVLVGADNDRANQRHTDGPS